MTKTLLVSEYLKLSLEYMDFFTSLSVDESRKQQVIRRLYELRELLDMEPIRLGNDFTR